ncbi:hypothetical protein A7982_13116 [Minicystis rosea]|nr:hypothetical protein A7982_13116 [Minicystis rosea]
MVGCAAGASTETTGGANTSSSGTTGSGGSDFDSGVDIPTPDAETPAKCGNDVCEKGESCVDCPNDCGQCPKCNAAPSCSEGLSLPAKPKTLSFEELSAPIAEADTGVPDGGFPVPDNCGGAQLRLRIRRLEVGHQGKQVWLPTGTIDGSPQTYYCLVQATDGAVVAAPDAGDNGTVEVALTKPTASIPDHGSADFGPADSIFWGQTGPRLTQNNLSITYSCFQQKQPGSDSWTTVLDAGAAAAGSLAGAGPYGWAFGLGSVALATVSAAVSAAQQQGDWHMFDVTHTIDKSWLLELTNGHVWSFTRGGGEEAFKYPWSLTVYVESWGCANAKAGPTP